MNPAPVHEMTSDRPANARNRTVREHGAQEEFGRRRERMNKRETPYVTSVATTPEELREGLTRPEFTRQYVFGRSVQLEGQGGRAVDRTVKSLLSLTHIASSACPRVRHVRSPIAPKPLLPDYRG
jgi:hypothetical protein